MKFSSTLLLYSLTAIVLAGSFLYWACSTAVMQPDTVTIPEFERKYHIDLNSDKYKHMQDAMSQLESYRRINTLSLNRESIVHDVELKGSSFTLLIDGVQNMVALVVGDHNENDFDIPLLQTSLNATVISLHSPKQQPSVPKDLQRRWKEVVIEDVASASVVTTIDALVKKEGIRIDTVFVDVRDNQWDVVRELVPHYSLMVRQYVVMSPAKLSPVFKDVREMKNLFRQSGYTYSRIGSETTVRVFMKDE